MMVKRARSAASNNVRQSPKSNSNEKDFQLSVVFELGKRKLTFILAVSDVDNFLIIQLRVQSGHVDKFRIVQPPSAPPSPYGNIFVGSVLRSEVLFAC